MITQEEVQKKMDEYGNIRYMLDDLKSSKESAYLQILSKYPEVLQEIQDMEEENGRKDFFCRKNRKEK